MGRKNWYVIQVQVGWDDELRKEINRRVKIESMERKIGKIILHRHPENVLRKGKVEVHQKKAFPGYLLIEMVKSFETIAFVKGFKGVISFLPNNENPTALSKKEVKNLTRKMRKEEVPFRMDYSVGDFVDVTKGTFKGMTGKVLDIDEWKPGLIRVSVEVEFMGKKTKVDMNWKELELA